MQLKGTVAIVTGGNGGLGQRICHALARAGSAVAVVYAQSRESAQSVALELRSTGVRAEAIACDVTSPSQVQDLLSRVLDTFGRVDVLVNDAAYNKWIPFTDLDAMTYEEWQKILAVNLTGPMLCIKAVAPAMRQRPGRSPRPTTAATRSAFSRPIPASRSS
jgi:3-oxoacyl-[acyl-carrier protein] reductase